MIAVLFAIPVSLGIPRRIFVQPSGDFQIDLRVFIIGTQSDGLFQHKHGSSVISVQNQVCSDVVKRGKIL